MPENLRGGGFFLTHTVQCTKNVLRPDLTPTNFGTAPQRP